MENYYETIDLLKGMIARPSFSREETAVADYLQAQWQQNGQKVFRKGNNLWLIAPGFDFGKPTLLLNSHIDTVKPAAGFTVSIWELRRSVGLLKSKSEAISQRLFPLRNTFCPACCHWACKQSATAVSSRLNEGPAIIPFNKSIVS